MSYATPRFPRLALVLVSMVAVSNALLAQTTKSKSEVPKLAGTWTWTWKDREGTTHRHVMEVEGTGTKVAARETFDDQEQVRVSDLKLDGNSVRFTVVRDGRKADYSGKVADADHINGTVTTKTGDDSNEFPWKAERRKDIPK